MSTGPFTLTAAEETLVAKAALGEVADFTSADPNQNDPAQGENWGPGRTIRAKLIYTLAAGTHSSWPVHAKGVRVKGAKIEGQLDFEGAKILSPLALLRCHIGQQVVLKDASAHSLDLGGSFAPKGANGEGLRIEHDVALGQGFTAKAEVRLLGATVGGELNCAGGAFENTGGDALNADRIEVSGSVFLGKAFTARGEVRLLGARIRGQLDCSGGYFENADGDALSADRIDISGNLFLSKKFTAKGVVRLLGATIGGQLDCSGGSFVNPLRIGPDGEALKGSGCALNAVQIEVKQSILLTNKFTAQGEVRLPAATIGGRLNCEGGIFANPARVGPNGEILEGSGLALDAEGVDVKQSVFLRKKFAAEGTVRLRGATIGGQLDCEGGSFVNPVLHGTDKEVLEGSGCALNADAVNVGRAASLGEDFSSKGEVRLIGATICVQLSCERGSFENPDGDALCLDSAVVKGPILLCQGFRSKGRVNLINATVGALVDDKAGSRSQRSLVLAGFKYGAIYGPCEWEVRRDWLRQAEFHPQPYEQLARVLRQMGREQDAREILFAKQQRLREEGGLSRRSKFANRFLELAVGYGYKPWRALGWLAYVFVFGCGLAHLGWSHHLMVPAQVAPGQPPNPSFSAILYSLDEFSLPPLDLSQKKYWRLQATPASALSFWILQVYFIAQALAGWTLTGLLIAALTGIIRKE